MPPDRARREGAHGVAHAELKHARKETRARHADHEALQNAEPRIGLHDAHEAYDRLARHQAVGVERDHDIVVRAPAIEEVAHIAGLEAGIRFAPAIEEAVFVAEFFLPGPELGTLVADNVVTGAVAQNKIVKAVAISGRIDARLHRAHPQKSTR